MTLNSKLNWKEDIKGMNAQAKTALDIVKVMSGKSWGTDKVLKYTQKKRNMGVS